jgi:intracellular sulfur oxidation DsrE/DsrF family protein
VVFHGKAGHVTLNDAAYNADRNIETGNPYKDLVTNLMSRGVQVGVCGKAAKFHHYGNEDLIPGIEVNTGAGARMIQLVQQGFVKITESAPKVDGQASSANDSPPSRCWLRRGPTLAGRASVGLADCLRVTLLFNSSEGARNEVTESGISENAGAVGKGGPRQHGRDRPACRQKQARHRPKTRRMLWTNLESASRGR